MGLGAASNASAINTNSTKTFHALSCDSESRWASNKALGLNQFGQVYNPNPNDLVLLCPFDADTSFDAGAPSKYNLDVYSNGAGNISTKSCVTYAGGGGGVCDDSAVASTLTNHVESIPVTPTKWQTHGAGNYRYVWVRLSQQVAGSYNVIFGYTVTKL